MFYSEFQLIHYIRVYLKPNQPQGIQETHLDRWIQFKILNESSLTNYIFFLNCFLRNRALSQIQIFKSL